MTYALLQNGTIAEYPVYAGEIKLRFPNTSFPLEFEPPDDYVAIADVPRPEISHTENVAEGTPELLDGTWTRTWVVTPASAEEIAQRTERQAQSVRADRTRRLAECDWTQLADAPVDAAAWATYRQALRDVPAQSNFPWEVDWPLAP